MAQIFQPTYRVGSVVRIRAAVLFVTADGSAPGILDLVTIASRYDMLILLAGGLIVIPFALHVLIVLGTTQLAAPGAPVSQILMASAMLGIGVQFCSGAALYGMGKYHRYSTVVAVHAVVSITLAAVFAPLMGIVGVALTRGIGSWVVQGLVSSRLF